MMDAQVLREKLARLHELILDEREAAKSLDMDRLNATVQEKEELILSLQDAEEGDDDLRDLALQVREENRRNAYLFWAGLNMVRETVGFFEKQVPVPGYGASGSLVQARQDGKLLSGRI